jgi:hypothetical protein
LIKQQKGRLDKLEIQNKSKTMIENLSDPSQDTELHLDDLQHYKLIFNFRLHQSSQFIFYKV